MESLQRLKEFFREQSQSERKLTFSEFESVLGTDLPDQAYESPTWWVNSKHAHLYAKAWLDADWEVTTHRLADKWVKFRPIRRVSGRVSDEIDTLRCSICGVEEWTSTDTYPNLVCEECDERAVIIIREIGSVHIVDANDGTDSIPVYIDGHKCWRRYRMGGWATMRDGYGCKTQEEFFRRHYTKDQKAIHTFPE